MSTEELLHKIKILEQKNKELENKIEVLQHHSNLIIDSTTDLVITTDLNGIITYNNKAVTNLYQYGEDELIGKPVSILWKEKQTNVLQNLIDDLSTGKVITNMETYCVDKNGNEFPVLMSLTGIKNGSGEIVELLGISKEIKSLKLVQKAQKESENLLKQAENISNQGSWKWDIINDKWNFSDNWLKIHGYDRSGISREELMKIAHPDDRELIENAFQDALSKKKPFSLEGRIIKQDTGEIRNLKSIGEVYFLANGQPDFMIGVAQDITEKRFAEQKLEASENKIRSILDNSPFSVAVVDVKDENIFFWSKSALDMFGHNPNTTEEWYKLAYPDTNYRNEVIERWKPYLKKAEKSDRPVYTGEYNITCKDGSVKICELYAQFISEYLIVTLNDITSRKKAEEKLKTSEQQYKNITENIPGLVLRIQLNPDGSEKFHYLSKSVENLFEIPHSEAFQHPGLMWQRIYPDDIPAAVESLKKSSSEMSLWNFKFRIVMPDGRLKWVQAIGTPSKGENGSFIWDTLEIEITDRVIAEEKLKANEELLDMAMMVKNEGIFDWNLTTNDIVFDDRFYTMAGYEPGEFPPKLTGWTERVHSDDLPLYDATIKAYLSGQSEFFDATYRFKQKDGSWMWIQGRGTIVERDENGSPLRFIGTHTDITEQKKAEYALRDSERRLSLATKSAGVGIWDWNILSNNMICDERIFQMYGIADKTKQITWEFWQNCLHPDDKDFATEECMAALRGEKDYNVEFRIKWPDGTVRWMKGDGVVIRDDEGKPVRMLGTNYDITEQKKFEQKIIEQNTEYEALNEELTQTNEELFLAKEKAEEANKLKTEFLHNMSHEVRTPMNGIIGFSEMLDEPGLSEEKRKYYSKIVQNSSHQLLRIIDDILEISTLETKQEKVNETEFCLNDLLMDLFSVFNLRSKERNIPLYLKKAFHDHQSYVISDKTKLNKILSNLLDNALKFTNEGYIEFGYFTEGSNLILYVKDTGIGISPQNHQIIFERFSQEEKEISDKQGGLGLGLSICKENVSLLGGDISFESEKGHGSTFYIIIPYHPVLKDSKGSSEHKHTNVGRNDAYTVLIAEDEETNYLYIETLFENELEGNYTLIHAKNGLDAVELCQKNRNIDLVLMDIKMPVMNGHEATKNIKAKFPNLPIIAQTAYTSKLDQQMALKHGCDDFISKPINKEILFKLINKYLKSR